MLAELNDFKLEALEEYIHSDAVDSEYLYSLIEETLSRPGMIYVRDKKGRKRRDNFIKNLMRVISSESENIQGMLASKDNLIRSSENLFDRLSSFIEKCDISKKDEAVQVWSHIKRVEGGFQEIHGHLEDKLSKKPKDKNLSPYVSLEDEDGNTFSADGASENLIKYLSITIKLLSYKFGWFCNDKIVIPEEVPVEEDDLYKAGSIELLARSWVALEEISQRSLLFGGYVFERKGEDVQEDAKMSGVKASYHFERSESEYELYDAIACERVRRKSLQNFMDIISTKAVRSSVTPELQNVGKIEDGSFLCEDEILTCSILDDVFCVSTLEDRKDYHGLTLAEWVRCYFVIRHISKKIVEENSDCVLAEESIVGVLEESGISRDKGLTFISLVSFSKDAIDLYDCPLIRVSSGLFYISYNSLVYANVSNIIISRLSSLDTDSSDKGYRFEHEVNELVRARVGDCKSFKFKRGENEYEYDAVFVLDDNLFILECKNKSLPWYNPVKSYRNRNFVFDSARQVNRLKNALIEYPEVVKEHFGIECSSLNIVPVVFNCLPFSWRGKIEGVYVTDSSSFSRLLKSSEIYRVAASSNGQESTKSLYKQWEGDSLCSKDIIKHFENPVQLAPFIHSRKSEYRWWIADDEVAFTVKDFEVDSKEYIKQERKIFKIPPLKNKKKAKSNRKAMIKKSRKANRKR